MWDRLHVREAVKRLVMVHIWTEEPTHPPKRGRQVAKERIHVQLHRARAPVMHLQHALYVHLEARDVTTAQAGPEFGDERRKTCCTVQYAVSVKGYPVHTHPDESSEISEGIPSDQWLSCGLDCSRNDY